MFLRAVFPECRSCPGLSPRRIPSLGTLAASGQIVPKSDDNRTTAQIGADTGDSYKTVQRYIRLTNLIPEILRYVDEGRISFTPAVELSYLNEQEQYDLLEQMELNDCTPSLSQACRFKKLSQEDGLTPEVIATIMSEEKANQREMFKVPMERMLMVAGHVML